MVGVQEWWSLGWWGQGVVGSRGGGVKGWWGQGCGRVSRGGWSLVGGMV